MLRLVIPERITEKLSSNGKQSLNYLSQLRSKPSILCEKLLIISQHFFGIPPFRFYALADGIKNIRSQTSPNPPEQQPPSLQMELLFAWEGPKI